jgi:hypothetical protein
MSTRLIRHGDLTARGLRGACLCGSVSVEVTGPIEHQPEACHCRMCRKQSGHVLAAVNVRRDALAVGGEQHVRWYRSSDKVERGFCSKCGSTLFWKPTIEGYQLTAVAMGLFDGPTGLHLSKHTFVGDRGDYYEIADGLPQSDSY